MATSATRGKQDIADYVLTYRNHKLAVIEAKRRDLPDTEGVGQAKKYAATTLGFKPATLRQWRRRRAIPAAAKSRLVYFFNDNFEILEAPPPAWEPSGRKAASRTAVAPVALMVRARLIEDRILFAASKVFSSCTKKSWMA